MMAYTKCKAHVRRLPDNICSAAVQGQLASTQRTHLKTLSFGVFHKATGVDEDAVHCFRVLRDAEAMLSQVS